MTKRTPREIAADMGIDVDEVIKKRFIVSDQPAYRGLDIDAPIDPINYITFGSNGHVQAQERLLPEDSATRKTYPMAEGLLDYFPDALAAVANVSFEGNKKHNPGQPTHWSRGKSNDHADCILRHLTTRGTRDAAGIRHSANLAWRALALLQEEIEKELGLPLSRGSR